MSTRSCIILKLRESDINRTKKFSAKKLPKGVEFHDWTNYNQEAIDDFSKRIKLTKPYIGIYCHSDGYPSGVGKVLKEKFNNYDDILNLIAGGDCSVVWFDMVRHYANRPGEQWEWINPKKCDTPIEVENEIDHEYSYLFENGEWKMKHYDENEFHSYNTEDYE